MEIDQSTLDEIATDQHSGETILEALVQFRRDMRDEQSADELVANALGSDSEGNAPCRRE